ncbi:hypothetical protein RhiirB3_443464 [Rhizophagus irregularis]|nr:hypothetical protein RhiirB3_443464 [Rhizophagus irregularis]
MSVNNKHKGECEVEPFDRKIDRYTKDLENIANFETGGRRERAQILLDNYREASIEFFIINSKLNIGGILVCDNGLLGRTVTKHRWLARLSVAQYSDIPSGLRWLARLPDVQRLIADLMGWLMKGEFYITKAWDSGRPYNQIHCHQPTFMDGGTINAVNGIVNGAIAGDETDDGIPSKEANDYSDDDEEALPPEDSLSFALSNSKVWTLPSGKNVGDIYSEKISENARTVKNKKRLTAVEKAILRYGASRIIDLSAHMKKWFCENDKKFIKKDYESMLRVPEMTDEENSFVLKVEDMVYKGHVSQAYKYCTEIHSSSIEDSYLYKISKIYGDFIYKSKDQEDILDFTTKSAHTELDVILKACAYIVEGLNKSLTIYPRWGESFCPLSRSADYINGRKCDVRFMTILGVDVGEWEFSAKATATKTIGDRCRSARINQSILNGLLEYNLDDNQVKDIRVPFLQFAGTNGQLLIEDLMEGFYVVLPGPKFELPTKLKSIGKLKTCIGVIKLVMVSL